MAIDRKFIGIESEDRFVEVEKGRLKLFATAVAELDPIYSDEAAARAAGHPSVPAPPTFAFSLALLAPAEKGSVVEMVDNVGGVLHGEQHFTYHKMIYAGDVMRLKTKTVDLYEKKGGKLDFIVQDTSAHNQHGDLCVSARTIVVVRN